MTQHIVFHLQSFILGFDRNCGLFMASLTASQPMCSQMCIDILAHLQLFNCHLKGGLIGPLFGGQERQWLEDGPIRYPTHGFTNTYGISLPVFELLI